MRTEAHTSIADARVRGRGLSRHALRKPDWKTHAICCPIGPPRLWSRVAERVLTGFEQAWERAGTRTSPAQRLDAGVDGARRHLAQLCNSLIERRNPDAALAALVTAHGELHCVAVGAVRVYLHRKGQPRRLTAREDEESEGLLHGRPTYCVVEVEPRDVVLAGSTSAFSSRAVERVTSVLRSNPETPASVLADLMIEPAARAGIGAAALALRVQ